MKDKITIIITDELPSDFLSYDGVSVNDELRSSRFLTALLKDSIAGEYIQQTKLYCHVCFKEFDNEEEWKKHKELTGHK